MFAYGILLNERIQEKHRNSSRSIVNGIIKKRLKCGGTLTAQIPQTEKN
jgi:hypothetical protein